MLRNSFSKRCSASGLPSNHLKVAAAQRLSLIRSPDAPYLCEISGPGLHPTNRPREAAVSGCVRHMDCPTGTCLPALGISGWPEEDQYSRDCPCTAHAVWQGGPAESLIWKTRTIVK